MPHKHMAISLIKPETRGREKLFSVSIWSAVDRFRRFNDSCRHVNAIAFDSFFFFAVGHLFVVVVVVANTKLQAHARLLSRFRVDYVRDRGLARAFATAANTQNEFNIERMRCRIIFVGFFFFLLIFVSFSSRFRLGSLSFSLDVKLARFAQLTCRFTD